MSTGRLIISIFCAFEDFEQDLFVERSRETNEPAKQ